MIPIGDDNRDRRSVPLVTWALIGANVLVFLHEVSLGEQGLRRFFDAYAVVPAEVLENFTAPLAEAWPVYLTLLTAMFLHGGWLHVGGNMLYLSIFGDNVEDALGHGKFLGFYLLCGLLASAAHVAAGPQSTVPSLGASGAIAGVLGAYLVLFPGRRVRVLARGLFFFGVYEVPALLAIGLWFALQFLSGVAVLSPATAASQGGVAYWAHIGGFVAGAGLVWFFRHPRGRPRQRAPHRGGWE